MRFTDQTLLATAMNYEDGIYNFGVAEAYVLAFFDKYLKQDTKTVLDNEKSGDTAAN